MLEGKDRTIYELKQRIAKLNGLIKAVITDYAESMDQERCCGATAEDVAHGFDRFGRVIDEHCLAKHIIDTWSAKVLEIFKEEIYEVHDGVTGTSSVKISGDTPITYSSGTSTTYKPVSTAYTFPQPKVCTCDANAKGYRIHTVNCLRKDTGLIDTD